MQPGHSESDDKREERLEDNVLIGPLESSIMECEYSSYCDVGEYGVNEVCEDKKNCKYYWIYKKVEEKMGYDLN